MPSYLFSKEALNDTPTAKAGVDAEVEKNNRIFACELIAQAGMMLRLPQASISTTQIILHRFYYRKSMKEYPPLRVAMTALFLATKVEESARKIRDILNVFDRLLKKRQGLALDLLDATSQRYARWRGQMKAMELVMLKELGYILYVDHPHKFFLHYINCLNLDREVAQRAWNFLNDSMRTNICLRFRPEVVATAAIFLAVRLLQIKLPEKWYELFDTSLEDMEEVASVISELYTRAKAKYIPLDEEDAKNNELVCLQDDGKPAPISASTPGSISTEPSTKSEKEKDKERDKDKSRNSKSKRHKKKKDKESDKKSNFSDPVSANANSSSNTNGSTQSSSNSQSGSSSSSSRNRENKDKKDSKKSKDKAKSGKASSTRRSRSRSVSGTRSPSPSRSRSRSRGKKRSKKEKDEPKKDLTSNSSSTLTSTSSSSLGSKDSGKKKDKTTSSLDKRSKSDGKTSISQSPEDGSESLPRA